MRQCAEVTKRGVPCKLPALEKERYCHIHLRRRRIRKLATYSTVISVTLIVIGLIADLIGIYDFFGNGRQQLTPIPTAYTAGTPTKLIVRTSKGRPIVVSVNPESGPPGTEFEIEFFGYEFGGSIRVEFIAPAPCSSVIESRYINATGFGDIRQSFTAPSISPIPRNFNPCLYGIYKAVFTNEADNEVLTINLTVIEPAP